MKRSHIGSFPPPDPVLHPPIPAKRQKGRSVWELLIASGQTDLLSCCIACFDTSKEMYAIMRTCKTLFDAACEVLKEQRMFIVPYHVSLKENGATLMSGHLTVPVHRSTWPSRKELDDYMTAMILKHVAINKSTFQLGPPIEIDQTDPESRKWWAGPTSSPLLPLDIARAHAKEKKKREFDAFAREAGLLPM